MSSSRRGNHSENTAGNRYHRAQERQSDTKMQVLVFDQSCIPPQCVMYLDIPEAVPQPGIHCHPVVVVVFSPSSTSCSVFNGPMLRRPSPTSPCPASIPQSHIYALALARTLATALRTSNRCSFRARRTLKRSKSVSSRLRCALALLCAHALPVHFFSTPSASHALRSTPVPAARGSLGTTRCVRVSVASAAEWRGTDASEGASTRTCYEMC